jgi:hypothetical protein
MSALVLSRDLVRTHVQLKVFSFELVAASEVGFHLSRQRQIADQLCAL